MALSQTHSTSTANADTPFSEIAVVRGIIRWRQLRKAHFPGRIFADPAWDILLDLYAASIEGRAVPTESLCIGIDVPQSTALRWIHKLAEDGLIDRRNDLADRRRTLVSISETGAAAMKGYLAAAFAAEARRAAEGRLFPSAARPAASSQPTQ